MYRFLGILMSSLILTFPHAAKSEPVPYVLDYWHSRIFVDYNHFGWSTMTGMFRDFEANLVFDAEQPERSGVSVEIDSASFDVFNEELNSKVSGESFMDADRHPQITFYSTAVKPITKDEFAIVGNLTFRGVTHPVTLIARFNGEGENLMGHPKIGFSAHTRLDRTSFGMNLLAPAVGNMVDIRIEVEAMPEAALPLVNNKSQYGIFE